MSLLHLGRSAELDDVRRDVRAPRRCMKPSPWPPIAHTSNFLACASHSLIPQREAKEVGVRAATALVGGDHIIPTPSPCRADEEGVPVLGVGGLMCAATADLLAVGARLPLALLRLPHLGAATISIALVSSGCSAHSGSSSYFFGSCIFVLLCRPGASGGPCLQASAGFPLPR